MHLLQRLLALGLVATLLAQAPSIGVAAVVYKWTDADGVVHFSDQPVPGAEKVLTSNAPSGLTVGPTGQQPAKPPTTREKSQFPYSVLTITTPSAEQTFVDEPVPVHLEMEPELAGGHQITWLLNGKPLDEPPSATAFSLNQLPRGAYVLSAKITDPKTLEFQNADSVTFYVQQPSLLMPQHK
jgi:hypothetical protein